MALHSSTPAWKIPWMEEPGRLQSMGSRRVGHDWATSLSLFTFHFHALKKEMATHSSVLAWRITGTGGLPSLGSHRVGHDWRDLAAAAAACWALSSLNTWQHMLLLHLWWWSWFSCSAVSNSCDPVDCSLSGSSVHGILQARILEWIAISFSRGSSGTRNWTQVSWIAGRWFTNWSMREALHSSMHLWSLEANGKDRHWINSYHHGHDWAGEVGQNVSMVYSFPRGL